MEKSNYCVICKYSGSFHEGDESLDKAQVYDDSGTAVQITLCRSHAVCLFKQGQRKFLLEHYKILSNLMFAEDSEFLKVLEKTVKKNYYALF